VRDEDGAVRLAINLIEDITEIKASEEASRFLSETSRALAASLDYDVTLRTVSELAVPELADWCFVDLRTPEGLERVAVAFAAGVPAPEAASKMHGLLLDLRADRGPARVARTGRAELYEHVTDADLAGAAPNRRDLALLRTLQVRSAMVVPMIVRHQVLGAITLLTTTDRPPLRPPDFALGEELGRRAAVAVDAARLHRASSAIAQTLQASLLPPVLPEVPRLRTGALYRAAADGVEVGGDFYDVFSVAEDQWFAVIGDVCGKGAEAATVTALARYTIRAAAVQRRSPAAILRLLGDAMLRQADTGGGRFCTIACVRLDVGGDRVRATVACGGHPLPAIVRAGGAVEELGRPGTLIGLIDEPDVADRATDLAPGDTLVLYTDGLTEARAPTQVWTPADLAAALTAARSSDPQAMLERLAAAATAGRAAPMRDDLALLALRVAD
jgi:serine phosphatase RsbU (regulator of sigma subunit)